MSSELTGSESGISGSAASDSDMPASSLPASASADRLKVDAIDRLAWNADGLIAAVVQHATSGDVLMLAWMNRDALLITQERGLATFWSRSRQRLWLKGETSGNLQHVVEIRVDCDGDTLLLRVHPDGPACHTGQPACFFRTLDEYDGPV